MTTTIITDQDITELAQEAGEAGDTEMVTICEAALAGDSAAQVECERVISYTRERASEDA